uniref:Potassium channel domain-containing protein n=1 Tax=Panagrolaimus sp. PS1159 TaxID=55785 RepID=A0AC35FEL4_9BILA
MKESYLPTQTWPRQHIPPKIVGAPDQQHLLLVASTIAGIKQATQDESYEKIAEFVETLQNAVKSMNNLPFPASRRLSTISEEPHFDSMILSNYIGPPTTKVSVVSYMKKDENGKSISFPYFVEEKIVEEPQWIRIVPHVCLTSVCILYMILGALMFKFLDPHIEKHPFHTCLMLSFQICFTVEWGNLPDEADITKILCIPYATIGIPLMFSTLSNYGRFLADGFCIYGVLSSSKPRMSIEQQRKQIPIKSAFHLLTAHQLIGIILFNTVYGKLGAVKAWHFIAFPNNL